MQALGTTKYITLDGAKKMMAAGEAEAVKNNWTVAIAIEGLTPLQGGLPVVVDGQVIGAVGVSGVLSTQDEQVAQAALDALTR